MGTYVLRRLLQMIPVFFGATFLIFYLVLGMPGDPLASMCGERGCDPATAVALRAQFHIGEPLYIQYYEYMRGIVTFDFGQTFSRRPVLEVMRDAFPITIRLAIVAFVIEICIGIPLGLIAGLRRGKFFDSGILMGTLLIISIPIFVVGFLMQYYLGIKLGWFRPTVSGEAPWNELLLPGIVLGTVSLAYIMRLTRTSVVENIHADYVRTAVAKGLPAPPGRHGAPAAQLDDPGGDVPRRGHRRPDGRRDRDRADLQHPRCRRHALSGDHPR